MCLSTLWLFDVAEYIRYYHLKNNKRTGSSLGLIMSKYQDLAASLLQWVIIVMALQLLVLARIEDQYPLVYSMSSFITICAIAYTSVCFWLI
jgi:uncharacterized membrane protein YqjE